MKENNLLTSLFGIPTKAVFLFFTTLTLLLYGACSSDDPTETPEEEQPPVTTEQDTDNTATNQQQTYTVSFNTNGGSEVGAETVNSGTAVKKPTDPTNTEHGGTFEGWYGDKELRTKYNISQTQ